MKPIGGKPSQKENETIASQPWQKIFWPATGAADCLRPRDENGSGSVTEIVMVNVNVIVIVNGIATVTLAATGKGNETETETVTVIVILTGRPVHDVMTTATTIVSEGTGRMSGSGYTAVALIEVRMMNSPMEMSDHQVHDVGDKMTMTTRREETRETQRYGRFPTATAQIFSWYSTNMSHRDSRETDHANDPQPVKRALVPRLPRLLPRRLSEAVVRRVKLKNKLAVSSYPLNLY